MKVFICSAYDGLEENYFKAVNYCKYVIEKGHTPICAITMLHKVFNDKIPKERATYINIQKELFRLCDEVWVFGTVKDSELCVASGIGKEIRYIQDTFRFNDTSEMLSRLYKEYETLTGRTGNRMLLDDMLHYLNQGLTDELIIKAIKTAARKSLGWRYAEGILKNCLANKITTVEEFESRAVKKQEKAEGVAYDLELYEKILNSKD